MTPGIPWVARWAACIAISAGWVLPATAGSDVNSWTKSSSGYWEEPFWSTGQLPSYADAAIMITNAGWKALAIGSGTTANYPNSLHIKSLTVDAPVDSHNLLLLNWAGVSVPLQADSMTVGTNGSLESHSSAMDVGTLRLDSQAVFADFGQSRFGSVQVGRSSPAQLNLSNGWFSADELSVASGAVSTFNQSGGSNQVSGRVSIDSEGFYNLSDGNFKAAFIDLAPTRGPGWGRPPHTATAPRFIVTGGRAEVEGQLTVGGFLNADFQPGLLQLSGGFFKGGDILVIQGDVVHTGGTNQLSQLSLSPAEYDTVNYVMSGGRLESARLYLGDASSALGWSAQGVFTQSAGVHTNTQGIMASGTYINLDTPLFTGFYYLSGGTLFTPGIGLNGGKFEQSGGTNFAQTVSLTNGGSYVLSGGLLISSNIIVQNYTSRPRPRFVQTAGENRVERLIWLDSGGVYELHGGVLSVDMISIRSGTEFRLEGGIVLSNNLVEIDGGTMFLNGSYSLGWLQFNGTGIIDFQSGSSIVHFTRVGYPPPALDGELLIKNWKGSSVSPGQDQLYIDSTDQYIGYHLDGMRFVDPAGYPPGQYRVRRKVTGELVPLERPEIHYIRASNGLRMIWPEGYQLFSSARATGPYEPVNDAQSGYIAPMSEPQRFFILRPTN